MIAQHERATGYILGAWNLAWEVPSQVPGQVLGGPCKVLVSLDLPPTKRTLELSKGLPCRQTCPLRLPRLKLAVSYFQLNWTACAPPCLVLLFFLSQSFSVSA